MVLLMPANAFRIAAAAKHLRWCGAPPEHTRSCEAWVVHGFATLAARERSDPMKEFGHEYCHDFICLQSSTRQAPAVLGRQSESLALAQVVRLLARSLSA